MFPDPCGADLAKAVEGGADPARVVPEDYAIVRGGSSPLPAPGEPFSGAVGPSIEAAAAAVPHGQIRVSAVGAIRAGGGTVVWMPEVSRHGTINQQHVDITEPGKTAFSDLQPNPVPRARRI